MSQFIDRSTENNSLVEAAKLVPERAAMLTDGPEKEAISPIVVPITALVGLAISSRSRRDEADAEWKRAQADRDACDATADKALRLGHSRLVEWADMRRGNGLVRGVFPLGLRSYTSADDDQPEMMVIALDLARDSGRPELTPERKAEFDGIIRPTVAPLAAARDRSRTAWLRRKVAFALYDLAADDVWVGARRAYTVAGAVVAADVVEKVFASMLVGVAAPDPAAPPSPPSS